MKFTTMKFGMMTLLLALVTASAFANVESSEGTGATKSAACEQAKTRAEAKCNALKYVGVDKYHRCDCSYSHSQEEENRWNCSVDASCGGSKSPDLAAQIRQAVDAAK